MSGSSNIRADITGKVQERIIKRLVSRVDPRENSVAKPHMENLLLSGPWGSGKTTLLRSLRGRGEINTRFDIWSFSPWEYAAMEEPGRAFLRFVKEKLQQTCPKLTDGDVQDKIQRSIKLIAEDLSKPLLSLIVKAANASDVMAPVNAAIGGTILSADLVEKLAKIWLAKPSETTQTDKRSPDEQALYRARNVIAQMLGQIAKHSKDTTENILLLVDDMDRCRPEEAITFLNGMYHLFLPHDQLLDESLKQQWPLACVWAMNIPLMEEFLRYAYKDLPSFRADAYLEKIFDGTFNLPPLTSVGEAPEIWHRAAAKDGIVIEKGNELESVITALADQLRYRVLDNLRFYENFARSFLAYYAWASQQPNTTSDHDGEASPPDWLRQARLLLITRAFGGFREQVIREPGAWPLFALEASTFAEEGRTRGALRRYASDHSLIALLGDLNALEREDRTMRIDDIGMEKVSDELVEMMKAGF